MITPTEVLLLRACVGEDAATLRAGLTDPAADVGRFLRFAHRHRLGDFVFCQLERLGATGVLPPAHLAAAAAAALLERNRTERLVAELRRLGERFRSAGVRVLFLKGPLLARRFYGSLDGRAVADLDVFIRRHDLARVEALLLAEGYAPAFRVLLSRRATQYFTHHFEYRREEVPLDVHWALQRHFTFAIDYERVWASAGRTELDGQAYEVLSPEYELVLQLLGAVTDLQVGKLALRSLVDVHRILRVMQHTTDWGEFCAARERERVLRPSAYVLAVALELLDCRADFPELTTALQPTLRELPPVGPGVTAALASRPLSVGHKLLALRLYEASVGMGLAWWLVSLPFRLAVYGRPRPRA